MKYQLLIKNGPEQVNGIIRQAVDKADMLAQTKDLLEPLSLGWPLYFEVEVDEGEGSAHVVLFPELLDKISIVIAELPPEHPDSDEPLSLME